jgi:hypothetical protein
MNTRETPKKRTKECRECKEAIRLISYKAFRVSQAPVREPMEGIPSREEAVKSLL